MGPCQMEADRGVRAALWLAAAQGLQAEPSLVAGRSPQAVLWPVAVRQVEAEETLPRALAAEHKGELQLALEQLLHKNDQNETNRIGRRMMTSMDHVPMAGVLAGPVEGAGGILRCACGFAASVAPAASACRFGVEFFCFRASLLSSALSFLLFSGWKTNRLSGGGFDGDSI